MMATDEGPLFNWCPKVYPLAPARGKTPESEAAADRIAAEFNEWNLLVLRELRARPGTWKEVTRSTGENDRNIQPRFSELKESGHIEKTGEVREGCAVMRVVDNPPPFTKRRKKCSSSPIKS